MCSSPIFSRVVLLVLLCMSIHGGGVGAATPCRKAPFLYAFGDSNTDTGGGSVIAGTVDQYPDGRLFFNRPTGRLCDGRLVIDLLCESLGTKYLTPYLELFWTDFPNGVNFALVGSDTIRPIGSRVPYTLETQMKQFQRFYNLSISRGLMSASQFRDDALYLFDIGQNDIDGNFDTYPFEQVLAFIPITISKIKAAIQSVYALGGRKFWVHSTGPLGCLPRSVARKNASKPLDAYGCIATENEAAVKLNARMRTLCEELRSELADATIVFVDLYAVKLDLVLNSTTYGFGDPFVACRNKAANTVCPMGARHVSWDEVHYTEAANMFVASKILSTNFSTPPLDFNFFCN